MVRDVTRRVSVVVYPGVQLLDVVGPLEILNGANELRRRSEATHEPVYQLELVGLQRGRVLASNGMPLFAERTLRSVRGELHTLLVPGALDIEPARAQPELLRQIARVARLATRVVSVCSGSFLLAAAGLLRGRQVTTHWAGCQRLQALYPELEVLSDPIFVRDGRFFTSAGVTAGMDLALHLVEADVGRRAALELARWFVMYLRRPGGQSQFSNHLAVQLNDREPIREVLDWAAEHLAQDLSVPRLARRARLSARHFSRLFRDQLGTTPAQHVARLRLEAARRRLEDSDDPLKRVAAVCGFGTTESLRRAFQVGLGVTPGDYRERFRSPPRSTLRDVQPSALAMLPTSRRNGPSAG